MVSAEREAARRGAGREATDEEVVARASSARRILALHMIRDTLPEDARRQLDDVRLKLAQRARRRILRRHRPPVAFRYVKPPERVQSTAREVRPRPKVKASSRLARDDDDAPSNWRPLDLAQLVRMDPGRPPVYACGCNPDEKCWGRGALFLALRAGGGAA
jgi:hypothetical protein